MPTIISPSIVILCIKPNADYRKLSSPPSPLISLTPYIKDLERDLYDKNIEELHRKEKDIIGFSDIVDFWANTSLPHIWPLSRLDPKLPYSFFYKRPYPIFFQLNSNSSTLYLLYFNHNNDHICVKESFFTNFYIDNPHYFAETCFTIFKLHAFFPMPNTYWDTPTQSRLSKEKWRWYWHLRNGIGKKKWCHLQKQPGLGANPLTFLLSYLTESFIADDIFADLLTMALPISKVKFDMNLIGCVPILTGQDNYDIWWHQIQTTLSAYSVWEFVDSTLTYAAQADTAN